MAVQGVSGVAKDLAKMSSKSAVKLLAPEGGLFRWVAALTGSKNAVKGVGFFLGAALLALAGFTAALWIMAGVLAAILLAVALFLPPGLPSRDKGARFAGWRSPDPRVNRLSLARMFLFGARDVWFVVGVPVYFDAVLSDGTPAGDRWAFFVVGGFLALWIIGYGAVQALAPRLLAGGDPVAKAIRWSGFLVPIPLALALAVLLAGAPADWLTWVLILGLMVFGFVFAINSSVHSYLILAFGQASRITRDVGFYYMSNAAGRRAGDAAVRGQLSAGRAAPVPGNGRGDGGAGLAGDATARLKGDRCAADRRPVSEPGSAGAPPPSWRSPAGSGRRDRRSRGPSPG